MIPPVLTTGFLGSGADELCGGCLTLEHLSRLACIHGAITDAQEHQPCLPASVLVVQRHQDGDARHAKVAVSAGDLQE